MESWLRRIAANMSIDYLRKRKHEVFMETDIDEVENITPESITQLAQLKGDFSKEIMQLSSSYRTVLWLHEVEGMTHNEVASLCGCSIGYSKITLSRAIKRLRQLINDNNVEVI
jgi:RNA polymerase sigma-70 factor (ECF subfamily)